MDNSAKDTGALLQQEKAARFCFALTAIFLIPDVIVTLLSGSMLLMSDLVDYGRVLFTTLVAWSILRTIRTGRTHSFDYGAGKLQTMGSMMGAGAYVAGLLVMAAMTIWRLWRPAPVDMTFTSLGALFQLGGLLVNSWLWMRNRRLARLQHSPVMEMLWRSDRADALSCLAILLGLLLTMALHKFPWAMYLDPLCALAFIIYAGVSFLPGLAEGFNELLDKTLQEELQLRIDRRLAENFAGYAGFHGVRSRQSGGRIFIEIALSFDAEQSVGKALETIGKLKSSIEADIPNSEVRVALTPLEQPCA